MSKNQSQLVAHRRDELALDAADAMKTEPTNMLSVIAAAAANPECDVNKMQALLTMQERIMARQAEGAYTAAMARLQSKLPRITKRGVILDKMNQPRSKWAKYEDIDLAIRPLLSEEGFSLSFDEPPAQGNAINMSVKISHREGHSETRTMTLPLDAHPARGAAQNKGSTISYGRRYLVCMLLNIVTIDEDDDGMNSANDPITDDQQHTIANLVHDSGADVEKFLRYMNVTKMQEITQGNYPRAINALNVKKGAQTK